MYKRQIESIVEPRFIQNIHFIAAKALYYSSLDVPNVVEANKSFSDCIKCEHFDLEVFRAIVQMEVNNGRDKYIVEKICPFVVNKAKDLVVVSEFYSRSAYSKVRLATNWRQSHQTGL